MAPHVAKGAAVVGLEPSCLLTLRDEFLGLVPGDEARALAAQAKLFDEFVVEEQAAGRLALSFHPIDAKKAVLHTHCHQKAFAAGAASAKALQLVPGLDVATFNSTCCGMAGAFGYEAEHYELSLGIGELGVLPRLRQASGDDLLVAPGTSCRHQIADTLGRQALHPARVLDEASS